MWWLAYVGDSLIPSYFFVVKCKWNAGILYGTVESGILKFTNR